MTKALIDWAPTRYKVDFAMLLASNAMSQAK